MALGHLRKIHDKKKRTSGEGLEAHPAPSFAEKLALARGENVMEKKALLDVIDNGRESGGNFVEFVDLDDSSDDDFLLREAPVHARDSIPASFPSIAPKASLPLA